MSNLDFLPCLLTIFLCFHTHEVSTISPFSALNNESFQCPMDLNYVLRIPWNKTACQKYHPPKNETSIDKNDITNTDPCCRTLVSLFGIGLAQHLKETSLFQLPSLHTSVSCLEDFRAKLTSLSFSHDLVSYCLDPVQFVSTPNICAHVQTYQDWVAKLGKSTALDTACKPDLVDLTACSACLAAEYKVQSSLMLIDGNKSHATDCFYSTVVYAAGFVNDYGPESDGAVTCIFGLDLDSNGGSTNHGHSALALGLTVVAAALLCLFY